MDCQNVTIGIFERECHAEWTLTKILNNTNFSFLQIIVESSGIRSMQPDDNSLSGIIYFLPLRRLSDCKATGFGRESMCIRTLFRRLVQADFFFVEVV